MVGNWCLPVHPHITQEGENMGLKLLPNDGSMKQGQPAIAGLTLQQVCRRMVTTMAVATGIMPLPEAFIKEERERGDFTIEDNEVIDVVAIAFKTIDGTEREYVIAREDALHLAKTIAEWLSAGMGDDDG